MAILKGPARPSNYLAWWGISIVGLAAAVAILTAAVDPYRMFDTPVVPGWTMLKPQIYDQRALAKTYGLERVRPATLLLGNSRVEIGLDPASGAWPADFGPIFDGAEAGRGLFRTLGMVREAIAVHPPTRIVLAADFPDFLAGRNSPTPGPPPLDDDERRLLVDRDGRPNAARPAQVWRDRFAATLSIDAVVDSVLTLTDQNLDTSATMTRLGFNPLHQYRIQAGRVGYRGLFDQKLELYAAMYDKVIPSDFLGPADTGSFAYLKDILGVALKQRIEVILFINPYHADYLELLWRKAFWTSFEDWKKALVGLVEAERVSYPNEVRLYDFSGYDEFTTECVPRSGDHSSVMKWYWEPGHYKSELGDRMIAAMFGGEPGFGVALDANNIDEHLEQIRVARGRYVGRAVRCTP